MKTFEYDTVVSTQEMAKLLLKDGVKKGAISALEQTGGKGRAKKEWSSPRGNLYMTFLLPIPKERIKEASTLSLVLGTILAEEWGLSLKWPNDLLYQGAKVGGILGEGVFEGSDYFLLLGIGLNTASHPTLDRATTSLSEIKGHAISLKETQQKLIATFSQAFTEWESTGFTPFFPRWSSLLIHQPGDSLLIEGKTYQFLKADPSGGLLLSSGSDQILLSSGEISCNFKV